jgi:uncharacterized repeat protein (TIGR03803 family)
LKSRRPLNRRQNAFLFDALEGRLLFSNGYALTTLASFSGGISAAQPVGSVVQDSAGDIFGVSSNGGANHDGAIWELPAGSSTLTILASFNGATTGMTPVGGLVMDTSGNLYGVTLSGGADNAGTVFEYSIGGTSGFGGHGGGSNSSGTLTVLASFDNAVGVTPRGLTIDSSGDLFGVTALGGENSAGAVFEVAAHTTTITDLASFPSAVTGANPGAEPSANLVLAGSTLYGSTSSGAADGFGTIFDISTSGSTINTVAPFTHSTTINSPLTIDGSNNIFGIASGNGTISGTYILEVDHGTSIVTTLALFNTNGSQGQVPGGALYENTNGTLFGLTNAGGTNTGGTVFEMPTTGVDENSITILADFSSGSSPFSGIIADTNGDLFATTSDGGASSQGALVELTPVHLVVTGAPALVGSGQPINILVQLEGPTGTVITGDDSNVTLTLNTGSFNGTTTEISRNGVATFNALSITATATYTITATATDANSDTPGASTSFEVAPSPDPASTKLVFSAPIASTVGATTIPTFQVDIENAVGTLVNTDDSAVIISISTGPSGATLDGVQIVQAVNGVATFSGIPLDETGDYTLVATDANLKKVHSNTFDISAAGTLSFLTQPTGFTARNLSATPVQVEFLDQFGNVMTHESHEVKLTVTPADGGSSDDLTASPVKGIATFKHLHFPDVGTFFLTATSSGATQPMNSNSFVVTGGPAVKMKFLEQPPSATTTGAVFGLTVELLDKYGNLATGDTSTVTISEGQHNGADLTGTLTAAVVNGVAVFDDLIINRHGKFQLTASDSTGALDTILSKNITVS